jgi:hypothetical protein
MFGRGTIWRSGRNTGSVMVRSTRWVVASPLELVEAGNQLNNALATITKMYS